MRPLVVSQRVPRSFLLTDVVLTTVGGWALTWTFVVSESFPVVALVLALALVLTLGLAVALVLAVAFRGDLLFSAGLAVSSPVPSSS